jgi:hypothetical protein
MPRRVTLPSHKPRRDRCLHFIFRQCFIPSPPPRAETEALSPHHHRQPPTLDSPAPTLYCYKKGHLNHDHSPQHSLNRVSILPPPWPEHHAIGAPPAVIIPFHHRLTPIVPPHNDTHGDKLADPLSLSEQLIDIRIHIKRYFKIPQHRAGLSTSSY